MPIDGWLDALPGRETGDTAHDLALFAGSHYPLLSPPVVHRHVARLSAHLSAMDDGLRRALIGYSLYTRQLDAVMDRATKRICRDGCERPPPGCCTRSHNVVFSMTDIMMQHPTRLALRMGDALARLQAGEGAHHASGMPMGRKRNCPYLTDMGCPLRLFKSPLCIHYLCDAVTRALDAAYGDGAAPFVTAMRRAANRQIERSTDFMEPGLIEAAVEMFAARDREAPECGGV